MTDHYAPDSVINDQIRNRLDDGCRKRVQEHHCCLRGISARYPDVHSCASREYRNRFRLGQRIDCFLPAETQ